MWGAVARGIGGAIVGEVAVALALNTSGFDKDVSKSVKSTEKVYNNAFNGIGNAGSAMFSKLGKAALALVSVGAIVKFSKQALQLGSDLQEVQNVVDVTFGSMSGAVNEYAQNAITSAGLSETVAKRYMGTFGAMSNQFGFTTEQSYEMSKAITQLTGDVASFYNLSSDEAYTKLKSIWTGETETLKEIGVVMTQNALDQYALANGYGKTTAKMTEQEKVALRYAFVQEKLSLASGDFVRTQDSWANQTRVLTLRWQQFMATVGQGLINVLTPLVKMLNVLLSKLQSFANAFRNFTASLFGDANANAGGSGSTLTNINDGLGNIGTTATGAADSVADAAKKMKRSLGSMDELNVLNTSKDSDAGSSGGISDQILGASGIGGLGDMDVSNSVNETGGALSKLATKVKELIKPLQEIDFTNLKNGLDKVKKSLEPITKKLGEGLEWLWYEVLVPYATWGTEELLPAWLNALAGALDFFNGVMDWAKPYLQWFWDKFLQPIAKWTGGVIVDVINGIGDGLSEIGKWLSEIAPTYDELTGKLSFDKLFKKQEEYFEELPSKMGAWLGDVSGTVAKFFVKDIPNAFDKFINETIPKKWNELQQKAYDFAVWLSEFDWKEYVTDLMNGLWQGIMDWCSDVYNKWIEFKNAYVEAFCKAFGIHSPSRVFMELGTQLMEGLMQPFKNIGNWAIETKNKILNGLSGLWAKGKEKGLELYNGLTSGLGNMKSWASGKLSDIVNGFSGVWSKFRTIGENMWDGLKSAFSYKSLGLKVTYDTNVGSLKKGVYKALGLQGWPKLSFLAQGGWVAANSPQLAVVGDNKREGEIIAPESKIREQVKQAITEMGGSGGKQQLEITIYHKYEDGKTIIQKVNQAQIDAGEVLLLT